LLLTSFLAPGSELDELLFKNPAHPQGHRAAQRGDFALIESGDQPMRLARMLLFIHQ
jgi:hypothetical protein